VGAFAKYSAIYGKATKGTLTYIGDATSTSPTVDANLVFDRSSWIFGGTISASF